MNPQELFDYVEGKRRLSGDSLAGLKNVVMEYPCFQSVRFLYLKNLMVCGSPDYQNQLSRSAIYSSNRRLLLFFLQNELAPVVGSDFPEAGCCVETSEASDAQLSLIDSFLSGRPVPGGETELTFVPPVDILGELGDLPDLAHGTAGVSEQDDLIDRFIQSGQSLMPKLEKEVSETVVPERVAVASAPVPETGKSAVEEDPFSESLARIYIKQKKYEEALEIIKKLSLKYPEKNIYFADQIRFLKKLIINNIKS